MGNIFGELPDSLPEELTTVLAESSHVRIERIVSRGHVSLPNCWYDQDDHEWVLVLTGEAKLHFENQGTLHLKSGDHVLIPAHQRHRVDWTIPDEVTIWLAVFYRDGRGS